MNGDGSSEPSPTATATASASSSTPSTPPVRPALQEKPSATPSLTLTHHRSPHGWFNPTHLYLSPTQGEGAVWSSRRARKGRYARRKRHIHDHSGCSTSADAEAGAGQGHKAESVYLRIQDVESEFKPHLKADVSFWVAVSFTFGSAVWVVNGFLSWFPFFYPYLSNDPPAKTLAATAFIGGTVFIAGSYLMVVEALDRGRETNFGTALGKLLNRRRVTKVIDKVDDEVQKAESLITHTPSHAPAANSDVTLNEDVGDDMTDKDRSFSWWGKPMWHDLGYVAALVQLFAASVFWIATITGLPGVIPGYFEGGGSQAIIDVFFWTPQVVGGTGFIISSTLLMIEVQEKWWKPKLSDLGWWVAVWNLVGALGFTLCGAFGYSSNPGITYESALSTWWGSWAFLFGSLLQCWEVVWREPSEEDKKDGHEQDEAK